MESGPSCGLHINLDSSFPISPAAVGHINPDDFLTEVHLQIAVFQSSSDNYALCIDMFNSMYFMTITLELSNDIGILLCVCIPSSL